MSSKTTSTVEQRSVPATAATASETTREIAVAAISTQATATATVRETSMAAKLVEESEEVAKQSDLSPTLATTRNEETQNEQEQNEDERSAKLRR